MLARRRREQQQEERGDVGARGAEWLGESKVYICRVCRDQQCVCVCVCESYIGKPISNQANVSSSTSHNIQLEKTLELA